MTLIRIMGYGDGCSKVVLGLVIFGKRRERERERDGRREWKFKFGEFKSREIGVANEVSCSGCGVLMRPMPGMVGLISSNSKDKKRTQPVKQTDTKRTRRDRGELEDIMFKLFERQPNWALKQLVQETDQPAQFLTEILNELCVYNKRGANQGTYELKPEYKKSVDDTSAE
ncbi:PREDICTED: transcription initiation factor IIF subunit beta-like [Lupinus angustifolius]|uniref:transcription initiation factor IIF subunit beta-like n=1 Tax=Lupinus angustifolius TaxID=3871 RepID=UPI00092E95A8|nr:PREDICTED: transcription initiation factor IIF subunit beta-like [Lupinus angustifolius]